ncbi:MAG: class I adenylate-forming enzyme family protein [Reyranellaceae bacterium]
MNLASLLHTPARCFAAHPAISIGDEVRYDYGALSRHVARLAGGLRGLGLVPGERVALVMSNGPEYLPLLFAAWHAGLTAAPMNARLHPREHAYMIGHCGARLCLASADLADGLAGALAELPGPPRLIVVGGDAYRSLAAAEPIAIAETDAADPAWLFYTSGTTGRPKGALLSHRNLLAMALAYLADVDWLDQRDCLIHLAAQSHASGLFALSHIARVSNQVLLPSNGFDIGELADLIARYENVTFFVPPTLLRRLSASPAMANARIEHIKTILCGAAPVYAADLKTALACFGPRLWNGYGQGESPCTITAMSKAMLAEAAASGDDGRLVSVGIARTGVELHVCDEAGVPLPPGEVGEVVVRGEVVMCGYLDDPAATRAAFGPLGLRTGDLGCLDGAGCLTLKDRAKDMVISGGINIYPREVEEVLLAHPAVAEAAVIGVPDAEWGERVVAFVVAREGAMLDPEALDGLCLERIARFKRPKAYHAIDALPKNAYGKVLKTVLRERLAAEREDRAEGMSGAKIV